VITRCCGALIGSSWTLEDFQSYEVLGRPYDRRDFFKGVGVSMYRTRRRAIEVARHFELGRGVAVLELRTAPIVWARTGTRGHFTVWAPPEVLLRAVLQCDEHG
jgi:hypothetical protein